MPNSFKFYSDAGLTTEITNLLTDHNFDLSDGQLNRTVYYGSTATGTKVQDKTNPGVDQIVLSVSDATPASGQEATAIKLGLTTAGRDAATPGDPLNLGVTVNSEVANAIPIYIGITNAVTSVGSETDLSLVVSLTTETPV